MTLNIASSTKVRTCICFNKENFAYPKSPSWWPLDQLPAVLTKTKQFTVNGAIFCFTVQMMVGGPPDHKYQWLRKHCLEPLSSWLLLASLHLVHGYHQLLFCTEALQLWKQLSSNGAGPELGTLGTQLISISQGRENSLQPISGQGPQRIFPFLSSLSGCHPIYFSVLLPYTPRKNSLLPTPGF